jgi:predicted TPR repeat methyltransferase
MKVNDKLSDLYGGYYEGDQELLTKRAIAARQSVSHIAQMLGRAPYKSLLDIGAGEGSVLSELSKIGFAQELHAVEISQTGVEAMQRRKIPRLESIAQFDGYTIEAPDRRYAIGTAIHVLEHVEHERAFLSEISRACELVYVEVPLELTRRLKQAIAIGDRYGHINFYNPDTFRNLLNTSGLEVLSFQVFPNSMEYEVHVGGARSGAIRHALRTNLLKWAPSLATSAMTYLGAAVCQRRPKS